MRSESFIKSNKSEIEKADFILNNFLLKLIDEARININKFPKLIRSCKYDSIENAFASLIYIEHDEFAARKEFFDNLCKILKSKQTNVSEIVKIIRNPDYSFIFGGRVLTRLNAFLNNTTKFTQTVGELIKNPKLDERSINSFIENSTRFGIKDQNGKPDGSNAAFLCSILLTSLYPEEFVPYKIAWWKNFATKFSFTSNFKNLAYASGIFESGRISKLFSQTETFQKCFKGEPHERLWYIQMIAWIIKENEGVFWNKIFNFGDKFDSKKNESYNIEVKPMKNRILYGPPGTGKTYNTIYKAVEIIKPEDYKEIMEIQDENKKFNKTKFIYDSLVQNEQIQFITFHQNYSYEDFVIGLKPDTKSEELRFTVKNGIFYELCEKAQNNPDKNYVLIIDEINRANISRVFGELITLIEDDKRAIWKNGVIKEGMIVSLPIHPENKKEFSVPSNLYIIGTMNTADKSIALVDVALRRRFHFIGFYPEYELIDGYKDDIKKKALLKQLNDEIIKRKNSPDFMIGHASFMNNDDIDTILKNNVVPLLLEYFNNDFKIVKEILTKVKDEKEISEYFFFDPDIFKLLTEK